jgi:hypothetical protein
MMILCIAVLVESRNVVQEVTKMGATFTGKIVARESKDSLYFDVIDEASKASFNKFLKTLAEKLPGIRVKIEIDSDKYLRVTIK